MQTVLILIQATQASRWLIFCPPVLLRLLSYGNENDNDKHLRSRTKLLGIYSQLYERKAGEGPSYF